MNDLAIWTEKLVKTYPGVRAVDGLNLNVPRGVAYGFLDAMARARQLPSAYY